MSSAYKSSIGSREISSSKTSLYTFYIPLYKYNYIYIHSADPYANITNIEIGSEKQQHEKQGHYVQGKWYKHLIQQDTQANHALQFDRKDSELLNHVQLQFRSNSSHVRYIIFTYHDACLETRSKAGNSARTQSLHSFWAIAGSHPCTFMHELVAVSFWLA